MTQYVIKIVEFDTKSIKNCMSLSAKNKAFREYSDQQKHESSCLLSESVSCISPEPLELQTSYLHLLHPRLKSFQMK